MLKANNIEKYYGTLPVLKNVSLSIAEGEIVSIVGPSGAGKSTLLHILGTLDNPDKGEVLFLDKNITAMKGKEIDRFRNENIGFIFQFHNLLPEFTALENVCIPAYIKQKNNKEILDKAKNILDSLGLGSRIHHKPSELSGGEQQRTAIARALINDPKIIFADEPSGNLDTQNAKDLHKLLFDLRDKTNQTFVIVTHNEQLAAQSDRMLKMVDGNLIE